MAGLVIDASVAVKWFLEEDRSAEARSVIEGDDDLFAPTLVIPEVVHALWIAARQGRTSPDSAPAAIASLNAVFAELTPDIDLIGDAVGLMRSLQHPIYDCLYLALGRRSKLPVLTADDRLFTAGRRARIPVRLL